MYITNDVHDWIKETNLREKRIIVCDYVEAGMISIYQLPHAMIKKLLKDTMKKTYGKYRKEIAHSFAPSETIKILHKELTNLILEAYAQIKKENITNMHIRRAFDLCGLNPYADENCIQRNFVAHLDSLSTTSAYQALIDNHTVLELDKDK